MGLEMKVIERVIGEKHDNHFLDAILNLAHGIADDEEPSLKIYFYLVRSNQARQLEDYTSAKRLFIKHIQDLNNLDRFAILLHLINFAVTQSYSSEKYWLREILDLYILGLEQKILIQNNNISPAAFTNIVINGIKLKEYDWLDYFIQHYKPYLDSDHREQIEVLCQASIFFAKEDFSNVTRLLTSHSFPKPIYKIRAKSVLLKTIYEELSLDDSQLNLFEAQSKSFERFLRRASKLTERESYINFVQILRKIAKARQKNLSLDKFLTKIKYQELQHMNIANKSWVLAKVEDFIQAKKLQKAGLLPS